MHLNRSIETNYAHKNYVTEYLPRRNRLTHSMLFEEFEILVEKWQDLNKEFEENSIYRLTAEEAMLAEADKN